jgi:hypothetical protein
MFCSVSLCGLLCDVPVSVLSEGMVEFLLELKEWGLFLNSYNLLHALTLDKCSCLGFCLCPFELVLRMDLSCDIAVVVE